MEVQSLAFPPPARYLDAFRAIHEALKPKGPLDGTRVAARDRHPPGPVRGARGARGPPPVARSGAAAPAEPSSTSAILFAAMHADPYRFLFTMTIGLVLGALRLRTGSLWPPVLAHVTLNALTFAIAPLVDDPSQPYTPQPALGLACLAAGAAVAWPLAASARPEARPLPPDCRFRKPCYPRRMRNSAVATAVFSLLGVCPALAAGAGGRGPGRPHRPGRPPGRGLPRGRGDRGLPRRRGAPRCRAGAAAREGPARPAAPDRPAASS